jgi:hypothetical protein
MTEQNSPIEGLPLSDINFEAYPGYVDIQYGVAEDAIEKPLIMRLTRDKFREYMVQMKNIEAYFNRVEENEPLKDWEKDLLEDESGE